MKEAYSNDYYFYNNSILIDFYKYPENDSALKDKVVEIINYIYPKLNLKKSGNDFIIYERHLKQIILNLIASVVSCRPIATSRNRNNFSSDTRYHKIQFSYTHLTKILDLLEALGYMEQKKGSNSPTLKKNTRFWPTQKFIDLLGETVLSFPHKETDHEVICLRARRHHKKDKKFASYEDTFHKDIPKFRRDINKINEVLSNADIILSVKDEIVPHTFLEHLQNNNRYENIININDEELSFKITRAFTSNINEKFSCKLSPYNYKHAYFNLHKETNKNTSMYSFNIIPFDPVLKPNKYNQNFKIVGDKLNKIMVKILEVGQTRKDNDYFYFDGLNVEFLYKTFHRVFNVDFDHGGRFYNGTIQKIPKYLRKYIVINGNKTIELDYSGFHIRLLYHLIGEEYQDDPYRKLIDKETSPKIDINKSLKSYPSRDQFRTIVDKSNLIPNVSITIPVSSFKYMNERDKYKLCQLILVNASDTIDKNGKAHDAEDNAIKGILKNLWDAGYVGIYKNDVLQIIDKFKKHHHPIADYLYSGKHGELQNIDSRIINDVMIYFAEKNITTIPIHDSIIIEEQYKNDLREQMMEVYKRHVGFYPVI